MALRPHAAAAIALAALALWAGACTIDRSRPLGAACVVDRECAQGLVCAPQPIGPPLCSAAWEGGLPDAQGDDALDATDAADAADAMDAVDATDAADALGVTDAVEATDAHVDADDAHDTLRDAPALDASPHTDP